MGRERPVEERAAPRVALPVSQHRFDFVKQAFRTAGTPPSDMRAAETRTADKVPETARVCAKPATMSDSLFSVRQPRHPAGIQLAAHYVQLAGANGNIPPQMRAACALSTSRSSRT